VITILGEDLNFDKAQAMKMATALGGGLGRWGTVCGAVSGGVMALGFCYGRTKAEEIESREKTYAKVQEMLGEFERAFSSIQCRELIRLNLRDPEDRQKFEEMRLHGRCARFVAKSAGSVRKLVKEK